MLVSRFYFNCCPIIKFFVTLINWLMTKKEVDSKMSSFSNYGHSFVPSSAVTEVCGMLSWCVPGPIHCSDLKIWKVIPQSVTLLEQSLKLQKRREMLIETAQAAVIQMKKVAALTAAVLSIRRSKTYNQRRLLAILREVLAPAQIFQHSGRA